MSEQQQSEQHGDDTERNHQLAAGWQKHVTRRDTWLRLLVMILMLVLWGVSRVVIGVVILVQFLWVLLTGDRNVRITEFARSLATYSYEIVLYLTWCTERRPFPFADWPTAPPGAGD